MAPIDTLADRELLEGKTVSFRFGCAYPHTVEIKLGLLLPTLADVNKLVNRVAAKHGPLMAYTFHDLPR
jgi:hypothetical protein